MHICGHVCGRRVADDSLYLHLQWQVIIAWRRLGGIGETATRRKGCVVHCTCRQRVNSSCSPRSTNSCLHTIRASSTASVQGDFHSQPKWEDAWGLDARTAAEQSWPGAEGYTQGPDDLPDAPFDDTSYAPVYLDCPRYNMYQLCTSIPPFPSMTGAHAIRQHCVQQLLDLA